MSRYIGSFCLWCFCLSVCFTTKAELNIEITQGMVAAVPIAVTPFQVKGEMPVDAEDVAEIVAHDLLTSGRFRPLKRSELPSGDQYDQVEARIWRNLAVENLVLGEIKQTSNHRYDVSFQLLDVFSLPTKSAKETKGKKRTNHILASKVYRNIRLEDFRALSHHMSDVIFEQLTNIRGAFSTRIAYVLVQPKAENHIEYTLEIADVDGRNPKALVRSREPIMSPAWSPDGKQLAFVSFEKKRAEIYKVDVITGHRTLISQFPGINGAPAWSPDGRQLAVVLSKDGSPKIYLYDIESKSLNQLTKGVSIDTEPTFAKDGRSLLFTSNRGGKPQIYRVNLQTNKAERVTFAGNYNARPQLTRDGKYLVMIHRAEDRIFRIARQELKTGEVTYLTNTPLDESPSISPNGAMILYGTLFNDRRVLGVVSIDGRAKLRLPFREGSVQEPAWSPYLS